LISANFFQKTLTFKRPAQTSRGILNEKYSWFIVLNNSQNEGWGECSVIPYLSPDFSSTQEYTKKISCVVEQLNSGELTLDNAYEKLKDEPSILFGVESAFLDLKHGGKRMYFDNSFSRGQKDIPINGLIWMGDKEFVYKQIDQKIDEGFSTIKLKIGQSDFEDNFSTLRYLRWRYSKEELTIRVDANGAFETLVAIRSLQQLIKLDIHSIEQPLAAGQHKWMRRLCEINAVPIALDEELIGVYDKAKKEELLALIRPQFIVLKPSLHGGISGTIEWIELAQKMNIGWWITSALESNIGLKTLCDFTANYNNVLPQGLGTGQLYVSNFDTSLRIKNGWITCKNE